MKDERRKDADSRRQTARRADEASKAAGAERRTQAIVRNADVLEIPLPPLKGPRDRRAGSRRRPNSA